MALPPRSHHPTINPIINLRNQLNHAGTSGGGMTRTIRMREIIAQGIEDARPLLTLDA